MLPCILLHATACQLRESTLDLLHAQVISSSITTSYYQKTAPKWALTTSGLLDGMFLAVNHALWFGEIPLV